MDNVTNTQAFDDLIELSKYEPQLKLLVFGAKLPSFKSSHEEIPSHHAISRNI
jgi:hypothetical protein